MENPKCIDKLNASCIQLAGGREAQWLRLRKMYSWGQRDLWWTQKPTKYFHENLEEHKLFDPPAYNW